MSKKHLIINRDKCIGCGACVAATDGKCSFIDGKAWCNSDTFESSEANDVVAICPVEAISDTESLDEYIKAKNLYKIKD